MHIHLQIEVMGCPTICDHCWAQGVPYAAMPLADIAWVLREAKAYFADRQQHVSAFPMHEVVAHPEAAKVLAAFLPFLDDDAGFEPLATTGVPLMLRADWQALLAEIRALGTQTFWVALHGFQGDHDALVHRQGAFAETCQAVGRIRAHGFNCGANLFTTRSIVQNFDAFCRAIDILGLTEEFWVPAAYLPVARQQQYETERISLPDVQPHQSAILARTRVWKEQWANLADYTEAAWVQRALAGQWPAPPPADRLWLVCRPNFDIYLGLAGLYGERLGNLKQDGVANTLAGALGRTPPTHDQLYYRRDEFPPVDQLARQVGNAHSETIHFQDDSMRYVWLDRYLRKRPR
ncbi:MAG: hypothetical protein DYG89_13545 [Caldilinea sp. CFX5]|nr:hypothetical protein [Caldilinea sp. CFX5]